MLQPTEETSDRTKHKFMVQSMCLERDVPLDELDATVRYNFTVCSNTCTCTMYMYNYTCILCAVIHVHTCTCICRGTCMCVSLCKF